MKCTLGKEEPYEISCHPVCCAVSIGAESRSGMWAEFLTSMCDCPDEAATVIGAILCNLGTFG